VDRVAFNFLSSTVGGGATLYEEFIDSSYYKINGNRLVVIHPFGVKLVSNKERGELFLPTVLNNLIGIFISYLFLLPLYLKWHRVSKVVNFGDLPIYCKIRQIYYFDWPYFLENPGKWPRMAFLQKLRRLVKYYSIKFLLRWCDCIVVQTKVVEEILSPLTGLEVHQLYPPFIVKRSHVVTKGGNIGKKKASFNMIYPAHCSPHKNHLFLVKVAVEAKKRGIPVKFVITVDEDRSKAAEFLMGEVRKFEVQDIIENVGFVTKGHLEKLYRESDGLFMPTLRETLGLPFLEAFSYGLPVVCSDIPVARELCGEHSFYFDPHDVARCIDVLMAFTEDEHKRDMCIEGGIGFLESLPTSWGAYFHEIEVFLGD